MLNKTKRLEILENSLVKKQEKFDNMLQNHFDTVKQANGQPLNDKGIKGQRTLRKWDKQDNALRNQDKEIEKTKNAIEFEKRKIIGCEKQLEETPKAIVKAIENGILTQWRKHPRFFFINGLQKVRLSFEDGKLYHRYTDHLKTVEERRAFNEIYQKLVAEIKEELGIAE